MGELENITLKCGKHLRLVEKNVSTNCLLYINGKLEFRGRTYDAYANFYRVIALTHCEELRPY